MITDKDKVKDISLFALPLPDEEEITQIQGRKKNNMLESVFEYKIT